VRGFPWLAVANGAIYLYILAPVAVVIVIAFSGEASLAFPPHSFSLRWFAKFAHEPALLSALLMSIELALAAAALALCLGGMAAFALVRGRLPGRGAILQVLLAPLMVPALVLAIALLQFFTWLSLPSFPALLLGHAVITLPYVVRTLAASLETLDPAAEDAAVSLGATRFQAIRKVTIPMLANGVVAALLFSFIVSFENLPIALFLSGPRTATLPLQIYSYIQWVFDPTVAAAAAIQTGVVLLLILAVERLIGMSRLVALQPD
jgi:putative spermidine/putrescine transport system permease protein